MKKHFDVDGFFASRGWEVFPFQRETWAAYRNGENGLVHASTGTGKTYAAFLGPVIEAMAEPHVSKPPLRVLWITPLRALAKDTAKSLEAPLKPLGLDWDIGLRTGDTASSARAKQKVRLPTVLVTTPESLALLLTHEDAKRKFAELRLVVVDEWHELLSTKRGVMVELALARLRNCDKPPRVWGLSATIGNTATAAEVLMGVGGNTRIIQGRIPKQAVIDSVLPAKVERFPWAGHLGIALLKQVVEAVDASASCLVFTNTRSQTEIWYQALLKARPDWAGRMALHHGSLDRKAREFVENELRAGNLRCVVCTSTLDLGVDLTPVDRVVQIGSPKGVARLLQRAGRSGHQPGGVSRVTCVPTNALELIEVAAARQAAAIGAIEKRDPCRKPLDLLAQHLVSCALAGGFRADELLKEVRSTSSYRDLSDVEWIWTLDFVVRGGDSLKAYPDFRRVIESDGVFRVEDRRVAMRHRMAVGAIAGDATALVRFQRGGRLGSVEEIFAARLKKGDRFTFAGRMLEFMRFNEMTVWVKLTKKPANTVPRWMGGRMPLSTELATAFRKQLDAAREGRFDSPEMEAVRPILELQASRSRIPAPDELLIERLESKEGHHLFLFPFEGRLTHEGIAALAAHRLTRARPATLSLAVNDYGFEILSPDPLDLLPQQIMGLLQPDALTDDILESLNASELVKRQFREVARIAGLVSPGYPGAGRGARQIQASSGLFYEVFREYDPDNLLLHQARREVLERQFEENRLRNALKRIAASRLVVVELKKPSPLAFPLLVERLRQGLSSEKLEDRVRRMTRELERD